MIKISILGAGPRFTPGVAADLTGVFDEDIEFRLIDINEKTLELCAAWGQAANGHYKRKDKYITFTDRAQGLKDADAVVIAVTTGGLEGLKFDLEIPEKYGIYSTVGDSAGPSGWSRSIRNIPVFLEFGEDFQKHCPRAIVLNYTNPMSALTAAIQQTCSNPVSGLCSAFRGTLGCLRKIFGLGDEDEIPVEIAGVNHFFWVLDFKIGGEDGYGRLRDIIGGGRLTDLLSKNDLDEHGKVSIYYGKEVFEMLFETYGYLSYPGDRHTAEFLPFILSGHPERYKKDNNKGDFYDTIKYCNVYRTQYRHRAANYGNKDDIFLDMISGKSPMPSASRGAAGSMVRAYLKNEPFLDAVNHVNIGQIPGLPSGACVETMGVVDGTGVHPNIVRNVPGHILELIRPHAVCQKWKVEGVMKRDKNILMNALYMDPQCACLKPHEIRAMAGELFEANRPYFQI